MKQLNFLLAPAAIVTAIAVAYGTDVVLSDEPVKGQTKPEQIQEIIRPMPESIELVLQNRIFAQACPAIDAQYGVGACQPTTIDFNILHKRVRGRPWFVRRFPQFKSIRQREPTPQDVENWINSRIEQRYCDKANLWYGDGLCNSETVDYDLLFIRNSGQGRIIADIWVPVFHTKPPPVDPSPPEDPP